MPKKYIVIGGVAGGMSAAARLRRLDEDAEIIVFERGEYVSFANCGLPYYIGDTIKERNKLLVQTPEALTARFRVDVRTRSEALSIDPAAHTVRVKDTLRDREYIETYDKLILSPGAEPVKPPIPGIDHPNIYTLWTLPDTDRIKAVVTHRKPRHAIVVGGGFVGLEMAENFHQLDIHVSVVEALDQVMTPLDFEMAALVHQHLRAKNVGLYLSDGVASFADVGGLVRLRLKSGREVTGDIVLLSIGVRPNSKLARDAGLTIGQWGGIVVNDYLQTSDPDIYAVGDAVEIFNPILRRKGQIPLAGPANKQGRMVADNIVQGNVKKYAGTMGTAVAKVFDMTVAATGANEKALAAANIPHTSTIIHPASHAGYYPNALQMAFKVIFSPDTGQLLGAQGVGYDGVDKRIDVIATALHFGAKIQDLQEIEHAYAPPYSAAKDPVNMAGFIGENILTGKVKVIAWDRVEAIMNSPERGDHVLIDTRTPEEVKLGTIPGAVNIPVDALRARLNEIPKDKKIIIFCRVGLRGYIAARILAQKGYAEVYNLSGGYLTYSAATEKPAISQTFDESIDTGMRQSQAAVPMRQQVVEVDACGLQCPGPVMKVKAEMDKLAAGDQLIVKSTDPGFYSDVGSWAKATGNQVVSLNMEKGIVQATIQKGAGEQRIAEPSHGNDKTIIVFDGDLDKAIASFIIANGALAMGRKVTLFFTFWGLTILRKERPIGGLGKNLIEKMFGWMLPRGSKKLGLSRMNMAGMGPLMIRGLMKSRNVDSLEEMIRLALDNGARIIACQMSMDLMGIRKEELIDGVEIGGVATYLECAEHADTNLFI